MNRIELLDKANQFEIETKIDITRYLPIRLPYESDSNYRARILKLKTI